jgi:septal ring factor EnvC (AmiA/AmiB activator)
VSVCPRCGKPADVMGCSPEHALLVRIAELEKWHTEDLEHIDVLRTSIDKLEALYEQAFQHGLNLEATTTAQDDRIAELERENRRFADGAAERQDHIDALEEALRTVNDVLRFDRTNVNAVMVALKIGDATLRRKP